MRLPRAPLLLVLGCALFASAAEAQVRDRRLRWRTIDTEHFGIHYPEGLGMLARRVAFVSERAHARLTEVFEHEVQERIEVVLTDDTDSANGSATVLPYANVRLFAAAPGDLTPLGDYDDWFSILQTHEDTHIVHLDTIGGLPWLINKILGKSYAPNLIQPRWFIEGLATHVESAETSGGRIRSSMFTMYMRMATLEDRLLSIDQLSNTLDHWPRGTAWYLYGGRFVDYIANRYGREALTRISHAYGRQVVPYGVNRVAQRVTGRTFTELYDDWQRHLRRTHGEVRDQVIASGRVEGERITFHGEVAYSPRHVDDETLVYTVADGHNDPQLRLIGRDGSNPRELTRVSGQAYPCPTPSGRILYDANDAHRDIYFMSDLFAIDPDGERTRLTHGFRARHPDLAPDGRRLAFAINSAGTTHLMIADVADVEATARVLHRSPRYGQVFTPRFSPDGRWIAMSRWRYPGHRDIVLVDPRTGDVRPVTEDRAMDMGPTWGPDGTLYFSSDRTGIANLYAYDVERGTLQQVTNVVGGAYSPSVSPNGEEIVYLGYSSYGFDLFRLPIDRARWRDAPAYVNDRPEPVPVGEVVTTSSRYRPARTVYPRSYLLDFRPDSFGTQLGINLAGNDIAEHHAWTARLGISLAEGYVNADATWAFLRTPAPVTLHAFRNVTLRGGGLRVAGEERPWVEDAMGADVGLRYSIPRQLHAESISATYSMGLLRNAEPFGGRLDPNTPPPELPETGRLASLRVGWGYSNVRSHFFDMFPSEGRNFGASVSVSHPVIGSQFRSVRMSWAWTRYVEAPWAQHHVFAFRYAGGISGGDLGRRGLFSTGGFPDANIVDQLRQQSPFGGVALRGYDPFSRAGTAFQLAQLEYRFVLGRIMRGPGTLPVFLNRSYALVFMDVGDAYRGRFDPTTLRVGAGAEIFLDFTVGYIVPFTMRVGGAYGFMDDDAGGPQFYAHLGLPF